MKFSQPTAALLIPDQQPVEKALARTTHLAIGAHLDDLEFMSWSAILECFQQNDKWYTGVTVTDGRGSARANQYADYTDEQMAAVRHREQIKAAQIGEYAALAMLDFKSSDIKIPGNPAVIGDIKDLLLAASPRIVLTHNLADKHDTHVAVALATIQAIRELPEDKRPKTLHGCEVWRNLDWMSDEDKVVKDVSERENLMMSIMSVFDSQISGGKRYDLATFGRKRANATYFASHATDKASLLEFAMDLTPLVKDPKLDVAAFVSQHIERFARDVETRLRKFQKK
ncbi:MAG: PIG-L family deacetylase [Verrucomicrobiae bacterium]|nr:PIG-L family deacetylase [Verrucomicrobiae bacterium]